MTSIDTAPARSRIGIGALLVVTGATAVVIAIAIRALAISAAQWVSAAAITAENIREGARFPAVLFDGTSSGTWGFDEATITMMYDGNDVPSRDAITYASSLRDTAVPYFASETINAAIVTSLSVIVLLLCIRLLRGRPFARHVTVSLAVFAGVVAVGSIASQLVRRIPFTPVNEFDYSFREDVASQILYSKSIANDAEPGLLEAIGYVPSTAPVPLDLTLLGVGVLIGLVSAVFAIGRRLQRDTDGLV